MKKIRVEDPPDRSPAWHDPSAPPLWAFDVRDEVAAEGTKPKLSDWAIREIWPRFAKLHNKRPIEERHKDLADAQQHFAIWLRRQDESKRLRATQTELPFAPAPAVAPPESSVEPLEQPGDIVYTPTPAELAKARLRAVAPAMLAGVLRDLPPDVPPELDFGALFPLREPEPRSMSA